MADGDDERKDDEIEEEEEELDERNYKSQKDAVIFAIEVSDSMLRRPPKSDSKKADNDSALSAALKCAYQIMRQRIISDPKDMMGILFFGTEKSKFREGTGRSTGLEYPHCYLFMDLDVPSAEDVKALRDLAERGEDEEGVLTPSKTPVAMSNVLFCANQIFTTKAANFGSRRLFIITDNDNPHASDKAARSSAAVRAKDLYDLGVVIELFPISYGDAKFDLSKFYDDIIYRDPAAEAGEPGEVKASRSGDGLTLLSSLVSNINSKQAAKRSLFSNLPFEVAPGLTISIKGYNILHRQRPIRTSFIWLGGEVPQIAQGETIRMAEDTAKTVEKVEMKKAFQFGGEYVYFTPEEQKALKDFGRPVLRIIGFKSMDRLPGWASIKKSTFIYPSEEDFVGSTRVFSALWQKLLKSRKFGVAWYIPRSNAMPRLVAIWPSPPVSDEDKSSTKLPAGLWLLTLPFADDVRDGPDKPSPLVKAPPDVIDKMRFVVGQLQLPKGTYNPAKYSNPALQKFYRMLQILALGEEIPDTPDPDDTEPKYKKINERAGPYIQEWKEALDDAASHVLTIRPSKRDVEDRDEDIPPTKKARVAGGGKAASASSELGDLKKALKNGSLEKWTANQLKAVLSSKGLSTAGKKADLLERLEQWIEDN